MSKKINKKVAGVIAVAALSAFMVIGGTLAYLTDNETTSNEFTFGGNVDIEGQEPGWDPDGDGEEGGTAEMIEPTETFTKDPQIENVGENPVYAYIEVEVPMADVIYVNSEGVRQNNGNPAHIELFEFNATGKTNQTATDGIGISEQNDDAETGWTEMYKKEMTVNGVQKMVYTYSLNKVLEPGEVSSKLFNTITFANIVGGQDAIPANMSVDLNFYAIQTINTDDGGATVAEKAKEAYDKYVNQNEGQSGEVTNDVTP